MSRFVPYSMRSSFSAINTSCDVMLSVVVRVRILLIFGQNVILRQ